MTSGKIIFDIQTYFHLGTGRGNMWRVNQQTIKDPSELPFISGRTVKGLCRDAFARAVQLGHLNQATLDAYFGSAKSASPEHRYETRPGALVFDDARLPDEVEAYLAQNTEMRNELFRVIHATALDQHCARAKSLRAYEVTVPLTLIAPVALLSEIPRAVLKEHMTLFLPLLRGIGMGRHRGLGRVKVSWEDAP
jgi:CRISPR/Cas system CSM-associated protein Csm3 (group 7 of RAMP superfamily)